MKKIFSKIESTGISIYKYKEDEKLCGYELNTYTNGGLNQIVFIDFRNTEKNPKKQNDFKELFKKQVESIDIDNEVELNRQNKDYRNVFTLTDSLNDITTWKKDLLDLVNSL